MFDLWVWECFLLHKEENFEGLQGHQKNCNFINFSDKLDKYFDIFVGTIQQWRHKWLLGQSSIIEILLHVQTCKYFDGEGFDCQKVPSLMDAPW